MKTFTIFWNHYSKGEIKKVIQASSKDEAIQQAYDNWVIQYCEGFDWGIVESDEEKEGEKK